MQPTSQCLAPSHLPPAHESGGAVLHFCNLTDIAVVYGEEVAAGCRAHAANMAHLIAPGIVAEARESTLCLWRGNALGSLEQIAALVAERVSLTPLRFAEAELLTLLAPASLSKAKDQKPSRHEIATSNLYALSETSQRLALGSDGELVPAWLPVSPLTGTGDPLYYRLILPPAARGAPDLLDACPPGLDFALGCNMARRAIREVSLSSTPRIGVRLPDTWAHARAWQLPLLALLQSFDAADAARLVIELPAIGGDFRPWEDFVRRARMIGCTIAAIGFGQAGLSLASLISWRPDIVELSPEFTALRRLPEAQKQLAIQVIALARLFGPQVVHPNIDDAQTRELFDELGVGWGYGEALACCRTGRPWAMRFGDGGWHEVAA